MPYKLIKKYGKKHECTSSEHNPSGYEYLEPGLYEWECPVCHEKQEVDIPLKLYDVKFRLIEDNYDDYPSFW